MSELPEMRASDTDRERIAERLREAVAEGRLTMEEFEERLDVAYRARTQSELLPLVRDLPAEGVVPGADSSRLTGSTRWRVGARAASRKGFAFWGGFSRKGTWTVPKLFTGIAVMGGGELDLRDAQFEDGDVEIRCYAIMGGIDIVVPPDLNVEVTGTGFLGDFGERGEPTADPSAPRVRITGLALMGGVDVERKMRKSDKHRLRAERERSRLDKGDDRRKELG
ncbi:DUF1707 domain-containing protein [Streptomyces sp. NPDC014894]|uniref:DUF1707 SHOCT-like domain-containing protein n=1 Tax=unclassified Streptomyces TaxID=2593676 RepID=UPI0036F6FAA9